MKKILLFLFLFVLGNGFAQESSYLHGHSNDDRAYSFTLNGTGGYVLAGSERVTLDSSERIVVQNISAYGTTIWKTVIDHPHHEVAEHIEPTEDGGYIVVGTKWDLGFGRSDMYLLKLNQNGELEWDNYYGGGHRDEGFCVKQTSDKGYIMAGFTKSDISGADLGQVYVVKTDLSGSVEWERKIGANGKDYSFDVQVLATGDFVISGIESGFHGYSTFEFTETNSDAFIISLDANGNTSWGNYYGGSGNELIYESTVMEDGGVCVIGSTQSQGAGSFDICLLRLDDQGNELWSTTYGDTGFDYGRSIDRKGNNLFIAGSVNTNPLNNTTDAYILKTDLDGNELWSYTFGGEDSEYAYEVRAMNDGGCVVVGSTRSYGNGGEDMFLLRLSDDGEVVSLENPLGNELTIYPNPSSEVINFEIVDNSDCLDYRYEIIDFQGRLVYSENKAVALLTIDVSQYGKGLYSLRVTSLCDSREHRGKFLVK